MQKENKSDCKQKKLAMMYRYSDAPYFSVQGDPKITCMAEITIQFERWIDLSLSCSFQEPIKQSATLFRSRAISFHLPL